MRSGLIGLLLILLNFPYSMGFQDGSGDSVIRTKVEVVNVLCTVRDKKGNYIPDLRLEDFEVFEDGVRQKVDYFAYEAGEEAQPLTVALLVDTSSSVKDKLEFEKTAASEFLTQTLRKNRDLAAVVQFDNEINLVQDFTFDLDVLDRAIEGIQAGGDTKLYDAIFLAVDEMLRHEKGRRVIVVLSDGRDTNSRIDRAHSIRAAQDQDVVIFGVGVVSPRYSADFGALKDFAKATGGTFFKSKVSLERIRQAFRQINAEIKNQYSIAYTSSNPRRNGQFRKIRIKLKKRGLKINHRRGYFSARSSPGQTGG